MVVKQLILFLSLFILVIPFCFANTDYNETGNFNSYFQQGTGFFNNVEIQSSADYDTYTRTISTKRTNPLVSDLDGDGINEIIILDGSTFRLYHNKELDIVDAYTSSVTGLPFFITYDIDNDGYMEIILSSQSDYIRILEYNGTDFYQQSVLNIEDTVAHNDGQTMLKCQDINKCLLVVNYDADALGNYQNTTVAGFNSTDMGSSTRIHQSILYAVHCFPQIPVITIADYDNDATNEYIFSFIAQRSGSGNDLLIISYVRLSDSLVPTVERTIQENDIYEIYSAAGGVFDCDTWQTSRYATSPLVFDIDGGSSNGLETIVGLMLDNDEFKMYQYDKTGTYMDEYPEFNEVDGRIVSNPMKMNAFPENPNNDEFCVMGYEDNDQVISLICGSDQVTWDYLFLNYDSIEFRMDVSGLYNITYAEGDYDVLSHAVQHSTDTTDGINLNEIVNSYGILDLDWDTTCKIEIPPVKCLDLIFENPQGQSVLISVDAEKSGREDLIALTDTNLWYIDDQYSNSDGYISYYYIDPCLDSTWKLNTSLEIRMKVNNIEESEDAIDKVSARAILYYNNNNEQDSGWSENVTAGSTIPIGNLLVNKTISTGTLRLMGRDAFNPTEIDIIDLTFSVGINGVEFGDCITESTIEIEEAEIPTECIYDSQCPNNYFCINSTCIAKEDSQAVKGFNELSGIFGLPVSIFWYMLMLALIIAGITSGKVFERNPKVIIGVMIIGEVLMLIIGTLLGFMPVGIIITLIIVGLIVLGLYISRFLTNSMNGGG